MEVGGLGGVTTVATCGLCSYYTRYFVLSERTLEEQQLRGCSQKAAAEADTATEWM